VIEPAIVYDGVFNPTSFASGGYCQGAQVAT
jgi:hypothetical protein